MMKRPAMLLFLSLSLLTVSCTSSMPPSRESSADLNSTLQSLGYEAVALPSTAYGPGSLVTSIKGSGFSAPLKLTYLCRPDYTQSPPPIIDPAESQNVSRSLNGSLSLDPATLTKMGLGASLSYIDSVTLKLTNVRVEQLALDDLHQIRNTLGPNCQSILTEYGKQSLAYQTQQAIRADVNYSIQMKKGASVEAKGLVLKALLAAFGGKIESNRELSASGTGLFYGLVLVKV
ncbi:hypothetical protein [Rhizobium sp. CF142]|uniref:hypothetical protein n=1 Tax=Rhizobium sp. CF142 TaxID=1144314 RepID=UPI00026F01DA|nr:hypothetical protein [Rhizobium sp. CF142]EJJ31595.1 hypothetical protein PMI11_00119 [Rhizobium sp. CF142]